MKKLFYALTAVAAFAFVIAAATPSEAVHRGAGDLTCGACHTMHNSQGGTKIVSGATVGGLVLLRASVSTRADIPKFCLSCHAESGAQASNIQKPKNITAPKVLRTSFSWNMTQGWNTIGGGGDFRWVLDTTSFDTNTEDDTEAIGYGHSVGAPNSLTAPGGGPTFGTGDGFSCTHCHDPHGAPDNAVATNGINRFRNLKVAPNGGTGVTLTTYAAVGSASFDTAQADDWTGVGSGTSADHVWPFMEGNCSTAGNCNRYGAGPLNTRDGISGWCSQCHPDWHESVSTDNKSGNDWRRHPVNNPMVEAGSVTSGAGVTIVAWSHYAALPGGGLYYSLPLAESGDAATGDIYGNSDQERVFCLSCHFAHGGPYLDALRWEHLVTVASGDMTGTGIPTNRGCQQCHNK